MQVVGFLGNYQPITLRQGADMVPQILISLKNEDGSDRDVTNGSLRATISKAGIHVADMTVTKLNATTAPQFAIDVPHTTTAEVDCGPTLESLASTYQWGADYTEGADIEPVAYGPCNVLRNSVP